MRLADVTLAFPTLLLLIAMAAALQPSLDSRLPHDRRRRLGGDGAARPRPGARRAPARVRAGVQGARRARYAHRARSTCCRASSRRCSSRRRSASRAAIMAESSLSFLGLGVQPPTPSWGSMIADGRDLYQLRHAPWTSVFPGLAIGAAVLGFNLLGDALARRARSARHPRGDSARRRLARHGALMTGYDVDALRLASFPGPRPTMRFFSTTRPPARSRSARSTRRRSSISCEPRRTGLPDTLQFSTLDRSRELIARLIGARVVGDWAGDEHRASGSTSPRSRCRSRRATSC